jgi:hypothetical protein
VCVGVCVCVWEGGGAIKLGISVTNVRILQHYKYMKFPTHKTENKAQWQTFFAPYLNV